MLGQNRALVNDRQAIGLAQGENGKPIGFLFLMQFDGITRTMVTIPVLYNPSDTFLMLSRLTAQIRTFDRLLSVGSSWATG